MKRDGGRITERDGRSLWIRIHVSILLNVLNSPESMYYIYIFYTYNPWKVYASD